MAKYKNKEKKYKKGGRNRSKDLSASTGNSFDNHRNRKEGKEHGKMDEE